MAFEVNFYKGLRRASGTEAQVPDVLIDTFTTSPITVPDGATLVRFRPIGGATITVTWPVTGKTEGFDGTEFRGCSAGSTIAVA
jgi:hypothetical protein